MKVRFSFKTNKKDIVFKGEYGESLYNPKTKELTIGLGDIKDEPLDAHKIKLLGGVIGQVGRKYNETTFEITLPKSIDKSEEVVWVREIEFGIRVYTHLISFKTHDENKRYKVKKIVFNKKVRTDAKMLADVVNITRDWVDTPSNMKTPELFAQKVKNALKGVAHVEILGEKKLKGVGMNGVLAVGQGSKHPPKVIIAEYGKEYKKNGTYAFVGKGVTFDSGGISLKPSKNMDEMKRDMAGAAAVLGGLIALAHANVKKHIIAVAGVVENMPDGGAQRPGDIIKMFNGKTVEVLNTDAEGRLVLADLLSYTEKRFKPRIMLNFATLTGAVIVGLGHRVAGVMSNDQDLVCEILNAGEESGDRCWQLPLWNEYAENIESKIADITNIGNPPGAGSIIGGIFLKQFVERTRWAHVDIAGTAWYDLKKPFSFSGATGFGVRLIYELVKNH